MFGRDVLLVDQAVERMPRGAAGGMESLVRRVGCERDDLRHRRIPHHQFPRLTIRLDATAPLAGGYTRKTRNGFGGSVLGDLVARRFQSELPFMYFPPLAVSLARTSDDDVSGID